MDGPLPPELRLNALERMGRCPPRLSFEWSGADEPLPPKCRYNVLERMGRYLQTSVLKLWSGWAAAKSQLKNDGADGPLTATRSIYQERVNRCLQALVHMLWSG